MGIFNQINCNWSCGNTSCESDNNPVEDSAPEVDSSCNVGIGSSTSCDCYSSCSSSNVGVGSTSVDACVAAQKAEQERQRLQHRRRVLGR